MDKEKLIEINELLNLLSLYGGEIVCSASLDTNDINQAKASGRMAVTENNIGYVWMPNIMRMPQTDEEVQFFEKWYPLDVEMPDKFNDADYVQKNIIDKVGSKDKLIEKITDIINSNFGDNNILKGSPEYAIKELTELLTSLTAPVPDGKEEINYKEKYEKCIKVLIRFDPGIIGMYDL